MSNMSINSPQLIKDNKNFLIAHAEKEKRWKETTAKFSFFEKKTFFIFSDGKFPRFFLSRRAFFSSFLSRLFSFEKGAKIEQGEAPTQVNEAVRNFP